MGDLDRRKHDVDVIERVLGDVRDTVGPPGESTRLISVQVPWHGGPTRSTVELTVGLPADMTVDPSAEMRDIPDRARSRDRHRGE